jgi:hypothetical protein
MVGLYERFLTRNQAHMLKQGSELNQVDANVQEYSDYLTELIKQ